jgi:phenylpropionate dioxygenase-like ring-hydroxylating dioxygenase large terminal subunit
VTLPLAAYFEPTVLERERCAIEGSPARYVGHRSTVAAPGDYAVAPPDSGLVVVNHDGEPTLLDNVCAHRQARLLDGTGRLGRQLLCPIHAWSYRLDGSLRHAPGMDPALCNGLERHPTWTWQDLIFRGACDATALLDDLDRWSLRPYFDFGRYRRERVVVDDYSFDWKIFIEVYLDLYHVRPFHPGLGRLVACDDVSWAFGRNWSCQIAPFGSFEGGTEAFEGWCRLIRERHPDGPPAFGALWLTIFPNTTVEWYPDVLVVSTIWPDGPDRCRNVVEYFYPESLGEGLERYAAAHRAAYEETAVEDGEICQRMHDGKRTLWRAGRQANSPDHDPLELGIDHFHEWVERHLAADEAHA